MDVGPGVVQASIALLADEQVGEVHLGTEGSRDPTTYSEPLKIDTWTQHKSIEQWHVSKAVCGRDCSTSALTACNTTCTQLNNHCRV